MASCISVVVSYLISFPLIMGEGQDGGGRPGPSPPHLNPPHLNPPPPGGGGNYFLAQLDYNSSHQQEEGRPALDPSSTFAKVFLTSSVGSL